MDELDELRARLADAVETCKQFEHELQVARGIAYEYERRIFELQAPQHIAQNLQEYGLSIGDTVYLTDEWYNRLPVYMRDSRILEHREWKIIEGYYRQRKKHFSTRVAIGTEQDTMVISLYAAVALRAAWLKRNA